jgi:phage terminase large subunit-like protein
MQMLGVDLMPWQRLVLDTALEINPLTKRLAYREVRLTVPRQQGKSTFCSP